MTTADAPVRRRKLSEGIERRLLALIQERALAPGDFLPSERELMRHYGVGRPAVREALQALQRMGLIVIRHGERARVAEPSIGRMADQMGEIMRHLLVNSPATLEHLKEARLTFEMEMARIAARRCSEADLQRLKTVLDSQEQANAEPVRFLAIDGQFHREIAATSGNPIFAALAESIFQWLMHFHVDMVRVPGFERLTIEEHAAILAGIEARDPERAARAMSDHITRANALYRQQHYGLQA